MIKCIVYVAITVLSVATIISFNPVVHAKDPAGNCDLQKIHKTDKIVKDLICDEKLGNFYLKYSPSERRIWIENRKKGLKLVLDNIEEGKNPEIIEADKHIKYVTPKIIRQGGKKFIGAVFAHRSRGNDGMGQCGSGREIYFASIEILKDSLVKKKQFLLESCFEPYVLDGSEVGEDNPNFLGALDGDEVVFEWRQFANRKGGAIGRFNFFKNELKLTERPRHGVEPKLIEKTKPEKK